MTRRRFPIRIVGWGPWPIYGERRRHEQAFEEAEQMLADLKPLPPRVRLWAISASVETPIIGGSSTTSIPTFYLDPTVQGILNVEAAERIACEILRVNERWETPHITAVPIY